MTNFILERTKRSVGPPTSALVLHCVRYERAAFNLSLFDKMDIAPPDAILRSVKKRQAEFLAGRLAAQTALAAIGAPTRVEASENRAPLWPAGISGSITHAGDLAIAAVAPQRAMRFVGIDAEQTGAEIDIAETSDAIFSPQELAIIHREQDRDLQGRERVFIFSAKESFYKAAFPHVGEFFDFLDVEVEAYSGADKLLTLKTRRSLSPSMPQGARLHASYALEGERYLVTYIAMQDAF